MATELRRAGKSVRRALYEAAGGNPLALNWALGLVAQKGYTLAEALTRLQDASRSDDLYAFLFAYSARDLAPSDRTVLSALPAFQTPVTAPTLANATGLAPNEIGIALERLVTLSLVTDLEGGRYGLHPLTRTCIRAAIGETGETTRVSLGEPTVDPAAYRKALRYWVEYAQKYGGDSKDAYQTFDRLEAEWLNLEASAAALRDMAGVPGTLKDKEAALMLNDLADALRFFLQFRGYWDERVLLSEWAYEVAKALGNWSMAGWRAYNVAWIHYHRAETDRAATWANRVTEAMERSDSRRGRAYAARMRGMIAEQRNNLVEAKGLYTEALMIFYDLGEEDDQGRVLNDLGRIVRKCKDYDRAEESFQQALTLAEKQDNKVEQAVYSGSLGELALDRGHSAEARHWYELELALAKEVGRQHLIAEAQAGLARVLEEEGCLSEGLPLAEQALTIREQLRDKDLGWTRQLVTRLREKVRK